MIFVVISVLVGALVYSPAATTFYVFAAQPVEEFLNSSGEKCTNPKDRSPESGSYVTCCWNNMRGYLTCQTCQFTEGVGYSNCSNVESELEQPPTPPPTGPAAPLQGGVLERPPTQGVAPPVTRDQGVSPQDGALQQPPADQGATELPPATEETQPVTEQSVPVCQDGLEFNEDLGFCVPEDCPEGQVLDEESGVCVLEEPEVAEPAESQPEQEQPSEESDSGEDSNN